MGWCTEYKQCRDNQYIHNGAFGANRVTLYDYDPNKKTPHNYYTTYLKYCPFCGAKLVNEDI